MRRHANINLTRNALRHPGYLAVDDLAPLGWSTCPDIWEESSDARKVAE
jgi:hypothetical protein